VLHLSSINQHYKTLETLNDIFTLLAMMTKDTLQQNKMKKL